ncbi:hypothetical protein ILYODFUR_033849 [Ilyodon furcidens]|uniref:Uncharacterized protein n=1 Tax=Ilyodon furcidens TaxID=33524 RepID=A0ABV0TT84_9TELE
MHGPKSIATPLPGPSSELRSPSVLQFGTASAVMLHEQVEASDDVCVKSDVLESSVVDTELQHLISENIMLKEQISALKLNEQSFKNNDENVRYYAGLVFLTWANLNLCS